MSAGLRDYKKSGAINFIVFAGANIPSLIAPLKKAYIIFTILRRTVSLNKAPKIDSATETKSQISPSDLSALSDV